MRKFSLFAVPVVAGATLAIATGVFASSGAAPTPADPFGQARAEAPTERNLAAYSALRAAASSKSAAVSGADAPAMAHEVSSGTATVGRLPSGKIVQASVNGKQVCVFSMPPRASAPAGACDETGTSDRLGVVSSLVYDENNVDFFGIVPDGVESVAVTLPSGKTEDLPVKNNGYAAHFDGKPMGLSFTLKDGTKVVQKLSVNPL